MHSRREIYEACMKLKAKAKDQIIGGRSIFCYCDPFGCGLELHFVEHNSRRVDDRIWVFWAKKRVFFGMPSKGQWTFEPGIWEEYLMTLVLYDGDPTTIKSRCKELDTYRFVASYDQKMYLKILNTALLVLEECGKSNTEGNVRKTTAKKVDEESKSLVEIVRSFYGGNERSNLKVEISDSWFRETFTKKVFAIAYRIEFCGLSQTENGELDYFHVEVRRNDIVLSYLDRLGVLFDWGDELIRKRKTTRKRKDLNRNEYHRILGVSGSATKAEIKRAYRNLARKYHPDGHNGQEWAEEKFKEISEAYQALTS